MEKVLHKFNLLCKNSYPNKNSIDIMEHLPTLYRYAKECDSVFETGVRGCISSWAFLYGLLDSKSENKKCLFMNDIDVCDINELLHVSHQFNNIDVTYEWKNNLLLEEEIEKIKRLSGLNEAAGGPNQAIARLIATIQSTPLSEVAFT